MLGKFFAAVDEPKFMLVALHLDMPEMIKTAFLHVAVGGPLCQQGFSADGQTRVQQQNYLGVHAECSICSA